MDSLRYKTAVVGASETTELGQIPDKTEFQLHVDASINAIRDCGIEKSEIDGIATTMSPAALAHYLGIVPKWIDNTQVGGTSFLVHVRHAAAAIAAKTQGTAERSGKLSVGTINKTMDRTPQHTPSMRKIELRSILINVAAI